MTTPEQAGEFDYSADAPLPSHNILAVITAEAAELRRAEVAVADAEAELATARRNLKEIAERRLPDLMTEAMQSACDTLPDEDGRRWRVSLEVKLRASLSKDRTTAGVEWLKANGLGGIVNYVVRVDVDRGADADERAKAVLALAERLNLTAEATEGVHPGTLEASLRQLERDGKEFPEDLMGVWRHKTAKVEKIKDKAGKKR